MPTRSLTRDSSDGASWAVSPQRQAASRTGRVATGLLPEDCLPASPLSAASLSRAWRQAGWWSVRTETDETHNKSVPTNNNEKDSRLKISLEETNSQHPETEAPPGSEGPAHLIDCDWIGEKSANLIGSLFKGETAPFWLWPGSPFHYHPCRALSHNGGRAACFRNNVIY